jgi:hypothetical protein
MTIRFLLDENIPRRIQIVVAERYPHLDVQRVGDPGCPPLRSSDDVILEYLAESGRVLITRNRTSMPGHLTKLEARGLSHWGVFQVRPGTTYEQLIDAMLLFAEASTSEEWHGRVEWIPY